MAETPDVFVNCPFDADYEPLLHAILFTVEDCGFRVRCALEADDSGWARIDRITAIIGECRFGIHDVSRTEPNERGLPRFNMPFELGLFLGAARLGTAKQKRKVTLILDREPYRYQQFLSDIAGQDVRSHGGDPVRLMSLVRNWLNAHTPDRTLPGGVMLRKRYAAFNADLPTMAAAVDVEPQELTYADRLSLIAEWLEAHP